MRYETTHVVVVGGSGCSAAGSDVTGPDYELRGKWPRSTLRAISASTPGMPRTPRRTIAGIVWVATACWATGMARIAQWIDPKPRDFTLGIFKCRSTPTGTLPTDRGSVQHDRSRPGSLQHATLEHLHQTGTSRPGGMGEAFLSPLSEGKAGSAH